MPSFTIGDYRIEVLDHARRIKRAGARLTDILGHIRSVPNDYVLEQFDVRAFYQGQPLPWGSYGPGSDFPNEPHREIIEWCGREAGATRGADFRDSFFTSLMYQLRKAKVARDLGRTITEVTDGEIPNVRDAVVAPVNLSATTLDAAIETLVGRPVR